MFTFTTCTVVKWREVDGSRETTLPYTLSGVLDLVARLGGYHCFWHDHHGNLAEASPPCWRKELEAMHERAWREPGLRVAPGRWWRRCGT